ncbi:MAG: hypothetical protein LBV69_05180 [Bacteroidales bacterium]|jgi:flavodoxin|nr:hypothetical protein [Bacteroidales bacterium]
MNVLKPHVSKKTSVIFLVVIFFFCLSNNLKAQEITNQKTNKILIVYYTWSGHTQYIANYIQEILGCDILEINPVTPYPEEFKKCTEQAKQEIKDGFKPELVDFSIDIEDYDTIFIGSPNWWSSIAPPIATLLTDYDFSGKTIIPFCTHGGGGKANLFTDMAKLVPDATILEGIAILEGRAKLAKSEVEKWLKKIEILQ